MSSLATASASPAIHLSNHCAERYQQRAKPALNLNSARDDLLRVLPLGRIVEAPPAWLARRQASSSDLYLLIGEDLVLPLRRVRDGFIAVTCLVRGCISEASRARRNRHRHRRGRRRS